ncbi:transcription/translation regulatory transformer protein RfaH [Pseudomonas sp. JL972]|uniref:transcription/translation regulatory transformer protein RfaH n=1 Tax=Stutzerimonas degradans TaxID=2968968 RepID=UPI0012D87676|nr:transcription/translation regulatory transformer protein RfaH [Stutzerimonas degradans]MTZ14677.1 transcription/translation regulatory transformer protein RfaH [Stutzerimonas degradans]
MTPLHTPRWYLVQTKPRQESRAEEHLQRQHYECYRPLRNTTGGRQQARHAEPLFPGYLFIRLDPGKDNWYPIRSTRGVSRVVSFGGQPIPVQDELIEQLRQRLAVPPMVAAPFSPGERVQISGGGLHELEAIFVASDGEQRSIILLNLLHRQQKITVPNHYLQCFA